MGVQRRGKFLIAGVDHFVRSGWEAVDQMPDGAASKAIDDIDAEGFGGARRVNHLLGAALADAIRVAIAPESVGQYGAVTLVNEGIGNALPHQMIADGKVL